MRHATRALLTVISLLLFTPATILATDNDFAVVAGGTINYKRLEFDVTDETFKPNLITFDLSFTGVYKSFYASVNYDKSIQDDYIYMYDPGAGQDDTILQISREDAGLTIGYNFPNSVTVFGGYIDGATTVYLQGNQLALPSEPERFNSIFDFTMQGPFLGVGYAMPVGQKNTLSFNIAYADMDGSLILDSGADKQEAEGESSGFSYGISLSGPVTETVSYRIGLKANRYTFDHTSHDPSAAPPNNDDFTHDQNFSIFYVGVSNFF